MQYTLFTQGKDGVGGLMKCPLQPGNPPTWLPYIFVKDVDATVKKTKKLRSVAQMWQLSERQEYLVAAALNPNAVAAVNSWEQWASSIALEDAPYPEVRLLTAVYAHLSRISSNIPVA